MTRNWIMYLAESREMKEPFIALRVMSTACSVTGLEIQKQDTFSSRIMNGNANAAVESFGLIGKIDNRSLKQSERIMGSMIEPFYC